MKNFQNYKAAKYADSTKYTEVEDGIYRTKDPYNIIKDKDIYVTSLTFEMELDNPYEAEASPQYIPQTPFEDLLDEFGLFVTDFYEEENEASEVTCYQEFGSTDLKDIQKLRTLIGKRFYVIDDPDNEGRILIKIE